ncbi:Protoporphyrinogen IX oxidase, novel form, HemJ [hydrothermal vent metagenome]|uniref:Protoporphyrinogen IX oxidase, novel form, HemJ n=1 Tax=hydrothermal vent metagenome TaxID=652676 RepID=A0A1W1EJ14_9ZZZZ
MEYYSWILTFHIMSWMSWMAMLFYLPRLFVYHRENNDKLEFVEVVKIQEYKLYKYIGLPAMWATIISGGTMLYLNSAILSSGSWMHLKLFFALLLIGYSFSLEYLRVKLDNDSGYKDGKFYRIYNEVPTLLSIAIVIFVIVKPI